MKLRQIDLVDIFVYLVVLGVFIQLFPAVISESFLMALLTAVLLKCVLELVLWVKNRIIGRIKAANTVPVCVINIIALLFVMPGSKFLVLELVALVFGDAVYLGGFFHVTALIIVLMLARGGMRKLVTHSEQSSAQSKGAVGS